MTGAPQSSMFSALMERRTHWKRQPAGHRPALQRLCMASISC